MLDDAAKLTLTTSAVSAAAVQKSRESGSGSRAMLDIASITSWSAFAYRIADGLGLQPEECLEQEQR